MPEQGNWGEPSDEAPSVRGALSDPHPSRRVQRAQASTQRAPAAPSSDSTSAEESRHSTEHLSGSDLSPLPPDSDTGHVIVDTDTGDSDSASKDAASAVEEAATPPRKRAPTDETPRGAFFGTGPEAASSSGTDEASSDGQSEEPSEEEKKKLEESGPDFVAPDAPRKPIVGSSSGRRPVKVRRILVECALCGYHVAVPPELFGKTVHCPECRADMMFSESSLEPVKDEIIGRIALEHNERRALEHPVGGPIPSPERALRSHRRNAVILFVLIAALVGGLFAFAAKVFIK